MEFTSLLDLPDEVLQNILSYLSFDTMAKLRPVCNRMNNICGQELNREFKRTIVEHRRIFSSLKPPSGLFYTLRYNLEILNKLQKTLGVYVKHGICVFYAGRILDILKSNLKFYRKYHYSSNPWEFRKLVRQASKHFTETIQPRYKRLQLNLRDTKKTIKRKTRGRV